MVRDVVLNVNKDTVYKTAIYLNETMWSDMKWGGIVGDYGTLNLTFAKPQDWVLGKVLETRAKTHKNKEFLQWQTEKPYTFSEVNQIVNRLAHGLLQKNINKGESLLVMLPNCVEYLFTWFAANKIGAVKVPVNTAYKGYFLEHVANNCKATIGIIHSDYLERFSESAIRLYKRAIYIRRCKRFI